MSNKVKVINTNVHPYKEVFQSKLIEIPPGEYVVMDKDKASLFLGTANPIVRDVDGAPMPESFKKLHMEPWKEGGEKEAAEAEDEKEVSSSVVPAPKRRGRPKKDVSESLQA